MNFLINSVKSLRAGRILRRMSTGSDLILVDVHNQTGVATVTMNRPPVNSLSTEFLDVLYKTLIRLESERCRGMVLTSSSPKIFTAGLDIHEIVKPELGKARLLWRTLQDIWLKLYSSPYPTAAAINGHAPAGGCLLALCCEYRVIVPNVSIGANETQLGIVPPFWFQDCVKNAIGDRQAEKALIAGRLFSSEEALKLGLVDDIADDKASCIKKAEEFLSSQINLPSLARKTVKLGFRNATISRFLNEREADIQLFIDFVFNPKVQERLDIYLQSLSKKSA